NRARRAGSLHAWCNDHSQGLSLAMDFLPVFLRLQHEYALVVGGGPVALRKVQMLLRAQARVRLVAPDICDELRQMLQQAPHQIIERAFEDHDLDGVKLVIAATSDAGVNTAVSAAAGKRDLPV